MNYTPAQIVDAVLNQLRASRLEALFPGITIAEYDGEFLAEDIEADIPKLPACLVMYGDENYSDLDASRSLFDLSTSIIIILGHRHEAGLRATARGLGGKKGLFDMACEVRRVLSGSNLNLQIDPIVPRKSALLYADRNGAMVRHFEFSFVHEYDRSSDA